NGWHLYYKIDLPADDGGLVSQVLRGQAKLFDEDDVGVDTTTFNPSRGTKVPGTMNCKGESTANRPHRLARLLFVPEQGAVVPEKGEVARENWLGRVAAESPPVPPSQKVAPSGKGYVPPFKVWSLGLEDDVVIEEALAAGNGEKFRKLLDGDYSGYKSRSEAD